MFVETIVGGALAAKSGDVAAKAPPTQKKTNFQPTHPKLHLNWQLDK